MKSAFACRGAAFALSAAGSGRGAAALAVRSSSLVSLRTPASGGCSSWRSFADAAAGSGGGMMGQIKELRARTGAGVMDCKEALAASAGDPAKAELWLLDKARSRFAKKAERPTTEGTLALALAHDSSEALLLELNSETDFVGRLEGFQKLALDAAAAALARAAQAPAADGQGPHHLDSAWLSALPLGDGTPKTVGDGVVGLFMQVGENMKARRAVLLRSAGSEGALGTFIQGTGLPHTGTLAALVALQAQPSGGGGAAVGEKLVPLANALAKHIAGINPRYLSLEEVPEAEAKEVGKEHVVLEQEVTYGEETGRVRELLEREGAKLGARVSIAHFVRWKVGDGLEKPTTDFAAEVEKELQRSTKH